MNLDNATVCKYCGKVISKDRLARHLDWRCSKYKRKCPICGKMVISKNMKKHLKGHKGGEKSA